ncbi:histidinol-phosphate transaminase [Owenweeksia hongkongensis]|uniref:histidinol-phosphate transaminase n=1 Tax=Owenweeksia hongkongensis TaxID=253245 RepID=UPI003A933C86
MELEKLVRPNILKMKPYSSSRDEFKGEAQVFLDANESPFGKLNRYPDPHQVILKSKIANQWNVNANEIFIGNGSDEIIDLLFRIFCTPGVDKALSFVPTYGMYKVSAQLNDVEMVEIPLNKDFDLDENIIDKALQEKDVKIIFLCSPNNPTGNILSEECITRLLKSFDGIVVMDEAYAQFSNQKSWSEKLADFPNLLVSQTFSKAWSLAAARVGIAFGNPEIIELLTKVKPPYNVSELNQKAALDILLKSARIYQNTLVLKSEREKMIAALNGYSFVKRVFPTQANFILISVAKPQKLYQFLLQNGIIVRNRSSQIEGCLRISIGTKKENQTLIKALDRFKKLEK